MFSFAFVFPFPSRLFLLPMLSLILSASISRFLISSLHLLCSFYLTSGFFLLSSLAPVPCIFLYFVFILYCHYFSFFTCSLLFLSCCTLSSYFISCFLLFLLCLFLFYYTFFYSRAIPCIVFIFFPLLSFSSRFFWYLAIFHCFSLSVFLFLSFVLSSPLVLFTNLFLTVLRDLPYTSVLSLASSLLSFSHSLLSSLPGCGYRLISLLFSCCLLCIASSQFFLSSLFCSCFLSSLGPLLCFIPFAPSFFIFLFFLCFPLSLSYFFRILSLVSYFLPPVSCFPISLLSLASFLLLLPYSYLASLFFFCLFITYLLYCCLVLFSVFLLFISFPCPLSRFDCSFSLLIALPFLPSVFSFPCFLSFISPVLLTSPSLSLPDLLATLFFLLLFVFFLFATFLILSLLVPYSLTLFLNCFSSFYLFPMLLSLVVFVFFFITFSLAVSYHLCGSPSSFSLFAYFLFDTYLALLYFIPPLSFHSLISSLRYVFLLSFFLLACFFFSYFVLHSLFIFFLLALSSFV